MSSPIQSIFLHPLHPLEYGTDEKTAFFLEGNTNSDVKIIQVHGELLKDPKIKRFYQHHGVV